MTSTLIGMTITAVIIAILEPIQKNLKTRWIFPTEINIVIGVTLISVIKLLKELKAVFAF